MCVILSVVYSVHSHLFYNVELNLVSLHYVLFIFDLQLLQCNYIMYSSLYLITAMYS